MDFLNDGYSQEGGDSADWRLLQLQLQLPLVHVLVFTPILHAWEGPYDRQK